MIICDLLGAVLGENLMHGSVIVFPTVMLLSGYKCPTVHVQLM